MYYRYFFLGSLMLMLLGVVTGCADRQRTATDVVNETFTALIAGEGGKVAQNLWSDTTYALTDADTTAFAAILAESYKDGQKLAAFAVDTVWVNDSIGEGFFEVTTTLADGKSVKEKGTLRKNAAGEWTIDVRRLDDYSHYPLRKSVIGKNADQLPYLRHALARVQAPKGDTTSVFTMANYYRRGYWEPKSDSLYIANVEAAAEAGCAAAEYALAIIYGQGVLKPMNNQKYNEWMLKAAKKGYPKAYDDMLWSMLDGSATPEVPRDPTKAFELAQKAMSWNPYSKFMVAYCYSNGKGVARDREKAIEMYKECAAAGEGLACWNLAVRAEHSGNKAEMVEWYKKGTELGQPNCMGMLGVCYRDGRGVPADKEAYRKLLEMQRDEYDDTFAAKLLEEM